MPETTNVFLLGLTFGLALLVVGGLIGFIVGRRAPASAESIDKKQFLDFLRNLSAWTAEFSGDVSKYQSQLSNLSEQAKGKGAVQSEELQALLQQIMNVNEQLQHRLDSAENRLEKQTDQISDYLAEARTDGLTGLSNRRAFDKSLDELFVHWRRSDKKFSLCLIDIDYFKKINDNYGHQAGDEVLARLAITLSTELGEAACVARYGGEEFAVLSNLPLQAAAEELEKLRKEVAALEISFEGKVIPITISVGCGEIQADDKVGGLVRRADEALYASKLGGRDRVHLNDGTICRLVTKIAPPPVMQQPTSSPAEKRDNDIKQDRIQQRLQRIVADETRRVHER